MGYDVSFHPTDASFIHKRVLPYVMGEGSINDLVWKAVLLEQVRARAHEWGLALLKWPKVASVAFNSNLHLWGRPFIIPSKDPGTISWVIDQYLMAQPSEVDTIVQDLLEELSPEITEKVAPKQNARVTSNAQLTNRVRWKMDLFREAYRELDSGRKVKDPEGREHDPNDLFETSFPLAVVEFAARFRPGWMSLGLYWPTYLMDRAGLNPEEFFEPPTELFAPLLSRVPAIARGLKTTIEKDTPLGGYVPPGKVASLRAHLKENGEKLLWYARQEKINEEEFLVELRKIGEALADATNRKMGFVEANGIYSTTVGLLN